VSLWNQTNVTVDLPTGRKIGDTIKIEVLPVQQSSAPVDFVIGKPFSAECKAANANVPCVTQISLDPTNTKILISGKNFGDQIGTVTLNGGRTPTILAWNKESVTTALPGGVMAGKTLNVVLVPAQQKTETAALTLGISAAPAAPPAKAGSDSTGADIPAATYAVVPLLRVSGSDSSPNYLPLDVTDEKGKPLTFTIQAVKKQDATTTPPATAPASQTCTVPCILPACNVACPQTPATPQPAKTP
jgi:hypothetical protein